MSIEIKPSVAVSYEVTAKLPVSKDLSIMLFEKSYVKCLKFLQLSFLGLQVLRLFLYIRHVTEFLCSAITLPLSE